MGTNTLNRLKNEKGMAIVWMAILIAVLVAMAGLAVDIGYMYLAKGQLQNAADGAALSGVDNLDGTNFTTQTNARTAAFHIASSNRAAGEPVKLDLNTDNTESGDIVIGHWNGTTFSTGGTINAVKVVARRTTETGAGVSTDNKQVNTFLGKIFSVTSPGSAGFPLMSAKATAIAAIPPRADGFFTICGGGVGPCTPGGVQPTWVTSVTPSTPLILESGKDDPKGNFAWTSLLVPESSANQVSKYICGEQPYSRTCGEMIYTTLGTDTSIMRDLESAMYDINYDSSSKDYYPNDTDPSRFVTGWWLIIPITDTCPAGSQGNAWDPKMASGYAKVHVVSICASGGGTACYSGSNPDKKCLKNKIVIDQIGCVDCAHEFDLLGLKNSLVQ